MPPQCRLASLKYFSQLCDLLRVLLCASERLRAHSQLRIPCQPATRHASATLLSSARVSTAYRARPIRRQRFKRSLALPKMWWTDAGHREAYCRRDPTSFSPWPGHCCRMKRLFTTRNFCVRRHAQSLRAWPLRKPRPSNFSILVLVPVFRFHNLFNSRGLLPCSAVQPRRVSTPHLPSIEFA
jgi:hypothetical protein